MDDAIETLQTCLRLLDLVHRVGEMIREGKYWGALRVSPSPAEAVRVLNGSHLMICPTSRPHQYRKRHFMRIFSPRCLHYACPSATRSQHRQSHGFSTCESQELKLASWRWSR